MSGGGGGGDLLSTGLMIAASVDAPELAPEFLTSAEGLGLSTGAASGITGAVLGAGTSALTGRDPLTGALMGGVGGYMAAPGTPGGGITPGTNPAQVGGGDVAGAITTPTPAVPSQYSPEMMGEYGGPQVGSPQAIASNIPATTTPMPGGQYSPEMMGEYGGPQGGSPQAIASNTPNISGTNVPPGSSSSSNGIMDWISKNKGLTALGGTAALMALINQDNKKYGTPTVTPYTGNGLQKFKYDPSVYIPNTAPRYAAGGIADAMPSGGPVEQMSRDNALGQNQMFPQSQLQTSAFSSSTNTPMGSNMIAAAGDTNVDPYTGAEKFAAGGGISGGLGSYAAGGNPHLLKGPGDGMSDNIPATISGKQPARLADGEFVVPADVVSHLGNGSTDAGAKQLYNMMDKVRKARTGVKRQGKQIKPGKYLPA